MTGYWEAAADGRVFGYHGATSCNSTRATSTVPVVGIAGTKTGYRTVARDGSIAACRASTLGSMAAKSLAQPVVGMTATPTGKGYWLVASDGGIFSFGDARYYGSAVRTGARVVGIAHN